MNPPPVEICSEVADGPIVTAIGGGVVFVRLKLAGDETPAVEAVTVYAPVVVLAVKTWEVAAPLEFVVSVSVAATGFVAKVPLAPVDGAVNVTETPLTGLPLPSVTVATRGLPNATPTTALCPLPLVAVIVAGEDAVFVRLKVAGDDAPLVDADTV